MKMAATMKWLRALPRATLALALLAPLTTVAQTSAALQPFDARLQRGLREHFGPAGRIESSLLRDTPTQSGAAWPKYYAWVRVLGNDPLQPPREGAARLADIDGEAIEVTHFVAAQQIRAEGAAAIDRIFPAALVPRILALASPPVQGGCLSGRPLLADEFAQTAVAVARVRSARDVQDDPEDPAGISATLYTVEVAERLHGAAPSMPTTLVLRSENTSSRFPMTPGQRYLLFIRQGRDGAYYVDACGHSGPLPQARAVLAQARRLAHSITGEPPR